MSAVVSTHQASNLTALVDRATTTLAGARSSAEILQAKAEAGIAYDVAKGIARVAAAQGAHDDLIAAVRRSQADAAEIEAGAKRRLADEYTAAQERGEVADRGKPVNVPDGNNKPATTSEIGISRKDIHAGRLVSDAEEADPGVVRRSLDAMLDRGEEPTRAALSRTLRETAARPAPKPKFEPGEAFTRFLALVDEIEAIGPRDILAGAGPLRSKLGQRASGLASMMEDIMEGLAGA